MEWGIATAKWFWTLAAAWVVQGYVRSPELMIGLGAVIALPPLALVGLFLYRRPQRQPLAHVALAGRRNGNWNGKAEIEIEGANNEPIRLRAGLTRIGRQEDNEICIPDTSVHRYHAAIERTLEWGVRISDLSGPEGNGVVVNGRRIGTIELADGDVVELGRARLRFACTPAEAFDFNENFSDEPIGGSTPSGQVTAG